jgi:copper chaperone NosL
MKKFIFTAFAVLSLCACSTGPQDIAYGSDGCHYCKMTIVEVNYGAELVTSKGKVYKFDAAECMINYLKKNQEEDQGMRYVINYENGEWLDAGDGFYLRSKNLPSPMGQYITAFGTRESAEKLRSEKDGVIQSWEELNENFEINSLGNF